MERLNSAVKGFAIAPSDTVGQNFSALYIWGAGAISVVGTDGVAYTLTAVPVGAYLPLAGSRINATGTTATNMVGFL